MEKWQTLLEICLLLATAGSPLDGRDVIINAHGVYNYIPTWAYDEYTNAMCSLQSFDAAAVEAGEQETLLESAAIAER